MCYNRNCIYGDCMEDRREFKCDKCGCCCKNVSSVPEAMFLDRGDGICKYYNEKTRLCLIEDFKPDICRVDKMYKKYKDKMSWDEYLELNYKACEELKEIDRKKNKEINKKKEEYLFEEDFI